MRCGVVLVLRLAGRRGLNRDVAEDSRVGLVEGRGDWLGVGKGIGWGMRAIIRDGRGVRFHFSPVGREMLAGVVLGVDHVVLVEGAVADGRSLERL
jgi:hypothetical protein